MVCFGDSITAGWLATHTALSWPFVLGNTLGYKTIAQGIAGTLLQNTNSLANNGRDTYTARVLAHAPDYVCILYGLCDILRDTDAYTVELYSNDLGEVVDGLVAAGVPAANIIIGSPPYVPTDVYGTVGAPWNNGSVEDHAAFVAAAATVAAAKSTGYIDVYDYMADHGGDDLIEATDPQGIHPNNDGHAAIAAAFASVMT
jgi:lysophospholipase L1-like esterase